MCHNGEYPVQFKDYHLGIYDFLTIVKVESNVKFCYHALRRF